MSADRRTAALKTLEQALKTAGVPVPVTVIEQFVASFTVDGKLKAEYAAIEEDLRLEMLAEMIASKFPTAEVRTLVEQNDQVLRLLCEHLYGHSPGRSGPSRFLQLLDRSSHWGDIQQHFRDRTEHCSIIVHGASEQNVGYLCARIRNRALTAFAVPHDLVELHITMQGTRAIVAEEWAARLLRALEAGRDLTTALEQRTREMPLVIMLCDGPRPLRVIAEHLPSRKCLKSRTTPTGMGTPATEANT